MTQKIGPLRSPRRLYRPTPIDISAQGAARNRAAALAGDADAQLGARHLAAVSHLLQIVQRCAAALREGFALIRWHAAEVSLEVHAVNLTGGLGFCKP